ncbi:hypothetical protein [Hymenobacter arizonensis]|uniref:DUF4468 domain-containing protein n=1 Tax=Hymenobacter arizonensis TaxID=1227077 RepID=A0A1I5T965_HYMAR|nr:hypothetical protein [Hymenobacter arizonensis]SFP79197.1 hypothetical protein SAMN04515668_0358 [Hymenobacter arizonensis]
MKILLALCLCLHSLTANAQDWPRNPKTNKVEFSGVLPWPAAVKTEAQRQALVRRWYLAKLTTASVASVDADAATNKTNGLLTYAGLPKVAVLRVGTGDSARFLVYHAAITSIKAGARIRLDSFELSQGDYEATPLEPFLSSAAKSEQAALATLRKRLVTAVKGWN